MRRPIYQQLIGTGQLLPGYACDDDAGIYFEGTRAARFVTTRVGAKVYRVGVRKGQAVERAIEPELIA